MAKRKPTNYTLRITRSDGARTYVIRHNGDVRYQSGDETQLALANLLVEHATETRMALAAAKTDGEAALVLRTAIALIWGPHHLHLPKVEVLS